MNSSAPESSLSSVPWLLGHNTSAPTTSQSGDIILCNTCISSGGDLHRGCLRRAPPCLKSPQGQYLTLNYETEDEHRLVETIIAMGSGRVEDRPPLTAAFLLCLCVQYSSSCLPTADLHRLLLLIAGGVQSAVWVSCGTSIE